MLVLLLTSCQAKEQAYEPKSIEIRENKKIKTEKIKEVQIDGLYELSKDSPMYESSQAIKPYDELLKGSVVRVLSLAEEGLVRVDYNGNIGYVSTKNLIEI